MTLTLSIPRGRKDARVSFLDKPRHEAKKKEILARDDHTCHFCGFRSEKYQEVIKLPEDGKLHTACMFCAQVYDLERVARRKSGLLVWLPEVSQGDLSHLARAIYVARVSQGPIADTARELYKAILARQEDAQARLGTDDPYILSVVFRDYLTEGNYRQRENKLRGIRLFPRDHLLMKEGELEFNQFPQILAYWRSKSGPFGSAPPQKWITLCKEAILGAKAA